jgi:bifunctional enzyme CysN/CysC
MSKPADRIAATHAAPLPQTPGKALLRFLTCGSVDDGKSTLIGRILYDCNLVAEDQLQALAADSSKFGTTGAELDLALLVDGLQAEREQGITIDVAYRYFATPRRSFIVADTPGHEQYTRNMATGASASDLAVILIDARKGVLAQTRRHSCIVHLLGIRHVVVAVNKMDLVGYDQDVFTAISNAYTSFATQLGMRDVTIIPMSARAGENVGRPTTCMPWYRGPTLLQHLEEVEVGRDEVGTPMRFEVHWVNRPNADFRGFSGTVRGGTVRQGDEVVALPSAKMAKVSRIVTYDGDRAEARCGDAVTEVLDRENDVSRGDVLASPRTRPEVADQFSAHLIWMGEEPMLPGRSYLIRCGAQWATASVTSLKHKISVATLESISGTELELNDIAAVNLSVGRPLVFDPYEENRRTGGFILVDRLTNATVGAGLIQHPLRRATNVHWQALSVDRAARAALLGQSGCCLWFTGMSGSGKSTVANMLARKLHAAGRLTYILDGDNVRHGLNRDLGFTEADRVENIRRVAHVARLMVDAGIIVLASFISPFRAERRMARELFDANDFVEVFVDAPLEVCEARDPKGLYARARAGKLPNFTGISSPYEVPQGPEVRLDAGTREPEELADGLLEELRRRRLV